MTGNLDEREETGKPPDSNELKDKEDKSRTRSDNEKMEAQGKDVTGSMAINVNDDQPYDRDNSTTGTDPDTPATLAKDTSPISLHHKKEDDADLEKHAGRVTAHEDAEADTEVQDENVVFWDGDDDPANPYNWSTWFKVSNCVLVSALTFLTPLGSCKSDFAFNPS